MGNSPLRRDDEFLGKCHEGKDRPKDCKCHHWVVDHLLKRYSDLAAGQEVPRVVVLQGASGVGKSRIVREMYERLRTQGREADDSGPGYWPPLEVDKTPEEELAGARPAFGRPDFGGSDEDPGMETWQQARKVLGPPLERFSREPRAVPGFFWWPVIAGEDSAGRLRDVRADMDLQMKAHLWPLEVARQEKMSAQEKLKELLAGPGKKLGQDIAGETVLMGLERLLELSGVVVPGLGLVVEQGRAVTEAGVRHFQRKKYVAAGGGLELSSQTDAWDELADAVRWLATPHLPVVIVVEDLHLMDKNLDRFLTEVTTGTPSKPVLVIGTAWPESRSERRPAYAEWIAAGTASASAELLEVKPLPEADLAQLARRYAPATDPGAESLRLVAQRWPNPYALKLAMTLGRMRRHIADGALQITQDQLSALPTDSIRDLYEARWEELPAGIKQALMLAAGCLPGPDRAVDASGVESGSGPLWPFMGEVVAAAAQEVGLPVDREWVEGRLKESQDPHQWARTPEGLKDARQFREFLLQQVAQKKGEDLEQAPDLPIATTLALMKWWEDRAKREGSILLADPLAGSVARWLAALPKSDVMTDEEQHRIRRVSAAAVFTRARDLASVYDYEGAVETVSHVEFSAFDAHDPARFTTERMRAVWTGRSGAPGKAARQLAELRQAVTLACEGTAEASPGLETELFLTWAEEAHWTAVVGRLEDALTSYKDLLECQLGRRESAIDRDALEVAILDTRFAIADLHGRRGDYPEAQEQLRDVVRAKHAMHDLAPAVTFRTRERLAHWAGEAGDPAAAIGQLEALLVEQQTASGQEQGPGAGQRDALRTRVAIARWKCRAGLHQEARADLDELISVMPRDGRNAEGHRSTASAARYLRHTCHTQHEPRSEHDERDGGDEESDPTLAALQEAWGMSADSERQAMAARLLDDIWFRQWYPLPTRSSAG